MADFELEQGEQLPAGTKIKYKDMGDGTHALVLAADASDSLGVPSADSTDNATVMDVVGNKEDAASQTANVASLVALLRAGLANTNKIDDAAIDGLSGTSNSLAYRVEEIEKHLHSRGRFWGALAAPDETNAIEVNVDRPFVAISGNNTWGAAIPICGTDDVPVPSGLVSFDAHRLLVVDLDDDTTPWRIRIIFGTGTSAAAISAEQWSEEMVEANAVPGNRAGGVPLNFQMPRVDVGSNRCGMTPTARLYHSSGALTDTLARDTRTRNDFNH